MAQENVKLFMEKLAGSDELKAKLKAAEEAYTGDKTDREKAVSEILIPLANEVGLPFTIDDLKATEDAIIAKGELDDDELAAVAGGARWCFFVGFGSAKTNNEKFSCLLVGDSGEDTGYGDSKALCVIIGVDWHKTK